MQCFAIDTSVIITAMVCVTVIILVVFVNLVQK
jgi:hypothetical protein